MDACELSFADDGSMNSCNLTNMLSTANPNVL